MNHKWLFLPIMIVVSCVGILLLVAAGPPGSPFWALTGNSGTNPHTNFLGTKDKEDVVIKTNGVEAMRIIPNGNVGIGTQHPGVFGMKGPVGSVDIRTPDPSGETSLYLSNSAAGQALLWIQSVNSEPAVLFGNHDAFNKSSIFLDHDTDALHFCVTNVANCQFATDVRLSIEPSGHVGIGTKTPQSALQVSGYTQLDLTAGAPPSSDCDEAVERGRMKVDSVAGLLYVCVDSGWIAK